jgi:hypothetical protein
MPRRRTVTVTTLPEARAAVVHLTPVAFAARIGKSVKTLDAWRYEGRGPAWLDINGTVRYRLEDIEAWEASILRGAA